MNSKNQTRVLSEASFGSHHASKMELSRKYFNRFNSNTSLVNKVVIKNNEIAETERGNSIPSSIPSKKETQTEPSSKKKKIVLTGDSMVYVISEKGLDVSHKVKFATFPIGTSQKILEKLYDIIKEKPGDLIVHAGTNDITNNAKLSSNVKKIFIKISKESPSTSIAFSSSNNRKRQGEHPENLNRCECPFEKFCMQKGISFIDNKGTKEFYLGKRKLHFNKKGNSVFAKNLLHHINRACS